MDGFDNPKIGTRLGAGFAFLIVLGLLMAIYGRMRLAAVDATVDQLTKNSVAKVMLLGEIRDNTQSVARTVRNAVLFTDEKLLAGEQKNLGVRTARDAELIRKLEASVVSEEGKALLAAVHSARQPYLAVVDKTMALALAGSKEAAVAALMAEVRPQQVAYFKGVDELVTFQKGQMQEAIAVVKATTARAATFMLAIATASALLSAWLAWRLSLSITQPPTHTVATMDDISASSRRIAEIIDGIALQTKILDLNAAVEAARAGKQGMGQVAAADGQLDQVTQQNAALVDESAAADSLRQQAERLGKLISVSSLTAA